MAHNENYGANSNETNNLPVAVPRVIFDLEWAQRASWIDFDYHTFYTLAHDEGISDDAIRDLDIHFRYDDPNSRPDYLGKFSWVKKRIDILSHAIDFQGDLLRPVEVQPTKMDHHLDSCFRHEMGHWVDAHSDKSTQPLLRQRKRMLAELWTTSTVGAVAVSETADSGWGIIAVVPLYIGSIAGWMVLDMKRHGEVFGKPLTYRHEQPAYAYEEKTMLSPIVTFAHKTSE